MNIILSTGKLEAVYIVVGIVSFVYSFRVLINLVSLDKGIYGVTFLNSYCLAYSLGPIWF